jgi:hypothetical protein
MLNRTTFDWITEAEAKTDEALALVKQMIEWFLAHYEDPSANTPYDDGYVYLCGGPYDAREEIEANFETELADFSDDEHEREEIIDAVLAELESAGGPEWAKIRHDVRLLRAHDHYWGKGHVHGFNDERDKTLCGRTPTMCPGDMAWGNEDDITCKACLSAIQRRKPSWNG